MWSPTKRQLFALTSAPLLLALSACGGSSGNSYSGTSAKASSSTTTRPGLAVATTSLGKVLVDADGMTVYLLTADKPGKSTCDSSCLAYWPVVPPLGKGAKPAGVMAPVASTTTPSGKPIETVGGWPLYTFVQDKAPGDVTGEGVKSFGGTWYAVSPSGQPVKMTAHSSSGSSSGYGSRY